MYWRKKMDLQQVIKYVMDEDAVLFLGAGFSYEIGKHAIIKSQTNYQYNIIQKKWEWFFGAGVFFTF